MALINDLCVSGMNTGRPSFQTLMSTREQEGGHSPRGTATKVNRGSGGPLREEPLSLPTIVFDHVSQLYDELAFFVLLTGLEGVFLKADSQQKIMVVLTIR